MLHRSSGTATPHHDLRIEETPVEIPDEESFAAQDIHVPTLDFAETAHARLALVEGHQ